MGAAVLVLSGPAFAEEASDNWVVEPAVAEVSLEEAVSRAMEQNPEIRAMRSAQAASESSVGEARSHLFPKLTFEERYMKTDNPTYAFMSKLNQERFSLMEFSTSDPNDPDDVEDWQTSLSFEQLIFSKQVYTGLDMAKLEARATGLDVQRKREAVALQVVKAYSGVVTSREFVHAAEQGLKDAQENQRIAHARHDAGLGLYSDVLRTDVFVKEAEERLMSARKSLSVARRALGLTMGLEGPVDARDDVEISSPQPVEHYVDSAMSRTDLKAMSVRTENAHNMVDLANDKYWPDIGVGGSYQYNDHSQAFGNEGESYQVIAFMRWNLFDGTLREHERAKAKHKANEAAEYLDGMKKEIRFRVHEAYLGVEEARRGLELAHARETLAEEGHRLVSARYENSLSTVVELLDAQSALDGARADVAEKKRNYLVALASLKYQSGQLLGQYLGNAENDGGTDEF